LRSFRSFPHPRQRPTGPGEGTAIRESRRSGLASCAPKGRRRASPDRKRRRTTEKTRPQQDTTRRRSDGFVEQMKGPISRERSRGPSIEEHRPGGADAVISRKSAGERHRNPAIPGTKSPRTRSRETEVGSRNQGRSRRVPRRRKSAQIRQGEQHEKCLNLFPPGTARRGGRGSPSPPRRPGSFTAHWTLNLLEEALPSGGRRWTTVPRKPLGMLPSNPEKNDPVSHATSCPGNVFSRQKFPAHPSAWADRGLRFSSIRIRSARDLPYSSLEAPCEPCGSARPLRKE